ncbi:MAG: hypothetical protein IJW99_05110 [Clostridia bacterium]|nr:hypothetical protein [Clostridia bacterium]
MNCLKKPIAALLALLILIGTLVACGEKAPEPVQTTTGNAEAVTTATSAAETEPAETDRAHTKDNLPEDLNFNDAPVSILFPMSDGGQADQIDFATEVNGEVVNDAVYQRQLAVEDRLGVKLVIYSDDSVTSWVDKLRNDVKSDTGSYDIVYGPQHKTNTLILENMYLDMSDSAYIDFNQPWWNNQFMAEAAVGERRYLLAGDISLSMLSYTSCMYFNKETLMSVLNQSAESLYQTVLDGKWTMDLLHTYCENAYSDLNGSGTADAADRYGIGVVTASTTDHMTIDAGLRYTTRTADGIPQLVSDTEPLIQYTDKLYNLFYQNAGVRVYDATQDSLRVTIPNKLMANEMVFMSGYFYSASLLKDMAADYGIIPYPKFDESIESYSALAHDSAQLVSVVVSCKNVDMVSAVLEALAAENYRTVTPAYYEIALKTKYVRDDISGQIIDLIHESSTTDFAYVFNNSLGKVGHTMRSLMSSRTNNFTSFWKANERVVQKRMEALLDAFGAIE